MKLLSLRSLKYEIRNAHCRINLIKFLLYIYLPINYLQVNVAVLQYTRMIKIEWLIFQYINVTKWNCFNKDQIEKRSNLFLTQFVPVKLNIRH